MTLTESVELAILRTLQSSGLGEWRHVTVFVVDDGNFYRETLLGLHAKQVLEVRYWDDERRTWTTYNRDPGYFVLDFNVRLTPSGKQYSASLEAKPPDINMLAIFAERIRATVRVTESSVEGSAPKAFISHATLDHPFVEKFAADLRANGVDAWFSKWEIKPGDSIRAD